MFFLGVEFDSKQEDNEAAAEGQGGGASAGEGRSEGCTGRHDQAERCLAGTDVLLGFTLNNIVTGFWLC